MSTITPIIPKSLRANYSDMSFVRGLSGMAKPSKWAPTLVATGTLSISGPSTNNSYFYTIGALCFWTVIANFTVASGSGKIRMDLPTIKSGASQGAYFGMYRLAIGASLGLGEFLIGSGFTYIEFATSPWGNITTAASYTIYAWGLYLFKQKNPGVF